MLYNKELFTKVVAMGGGMYFALATIRYKGEKGWGLPGS